MEVVMELVVVSYLVQEAVEVVLMCVMEEAV